MLRNALLLFLFAAGLTFTGCDDYVDIRTEGKLVPYETDNYRYLLNNTSIYDYGYDLVDLASDDIDVLNNTQATYFSSSTYYRPFMNAYLWADSIYYNSESDYQMEAFYTALYYVNTVITEVMTSDGGTEAEKLAIQGEALVHRAYIFLMMVNVFGKAYDEATSVTDLGAPMFTEPTVDEDVVRATVQEMYDQIVSDLEDAIASGLAATNSGTQVAFPSQASAYALLARAYLYMGNYEEALENAESALALQSTLVNLEDYVGTGTYPTRQNDPELILSKKSYYTFTYSPMILSLSEELIALFDENDLRYQLFTRPISQDVDYTYTGDTRYYCMEKYNYVGRQAGPTVPEMMLIQAECQARLGQADNAMSTINALRQSRFKAEDFAVLTATDADDALLQVLNERRRELMARGGFRWFDLKRLNKETRFAKTITHHFQDQTLTLEPNANRYQFPFASTYFQYAPDLVQNP